MKSGSGKEKGKHEKQLGIRKLDECYGTTGKRYGIACVAYRSGRTGADNVSILGI
jgi:hypothetical protein